MRTAEQMYEEAVKVCGRVAMTEGDHDFMVTREEYLLVQSQPFKSWIGTAVDREAITGKPQRLCGLVLKIKEDQPVAEEPFASRLSASFKDVFESHGCDTDGTKE